MPIATNDQGEAVYLNGSSQWVPAPIATNDVGDKLAFDGSRWTPLGQPKDLETAVAAKQQYVADLARNIPGSARKVATDFYNAVTNPSETLAAAKNVGVGALQKLGVMGGEDKTQFADAVGNYVSDHYGSWDKFTKSLRDDPVGTLMDVSTVFSLGGGALAKAPGTIGRIGEVAKTVGAVTNPLTVPAELAKAGGKLLARTAGELATGAGEALVKGAEAGAKGGEQASTFASHLYRTGDVTDLVDQASKALGNLKTEAQAAYNAGMIPIKADYHILDFDKIDKAIASVEDVKKFKGVDISRPTQAIRKEIKSVVDDWRGYAPAQYHTPAGIDALKQSVQEIASSAPLGSPSQKIATAVSKAIWQTVQDQAPEYAKVMKGYHEASELISEIRSTLSLKPTANVDTTLRKLYSVLRNNANTNYGRRSELVAQLERAGATNLIPGIAGQSLNSILPRGLGSRLLTGIGAGAAGGAAATGHLAALPLLPFFSPVVAGSTALGLGAGSRAVNRYTGILAGQAGRLSPQGNP